MATVRIHHSTACHYFERPSPFSKNLTTWPCRKELHDPPLAAGVFR